MKYERSDKRMMVWFDKSDWEQGEPADVILTNEQMNELVVEWLRGPMGFQGPAGPQGLGV